ncbi:MAG: heparinase II/III family protein [Pseudomonadota bacterium]
MGEAMGLWQRAALLRAGFYRIPSTYVSFPEPRPRGLPARGIQYTSGNFVVEGDVIEAPGQSIWNIGADAPSSRRAALSFEWVDDLAACGTRAASQLIRDWFDEWLANHERIRGEVWVPDLVAARLIRMVNHGPIFLAGRTEADQKAFFRTVSQHYRFLTFTWTRTAADLSRISALVAMLFASYAMDATGKEFETHLEDLGLTCDTMIGDDGSIAGRNPEELMQVFSLLSWASRVLEALDYPQNKSILKALERIAPCLRSLRFANGNLAVFNGGGPGMLGRLDQALADGRVRFPAYPEGAMGFVRMAASRSVLIADAGPSVLPTPTAIEFAVGRHPIFVNMGALDIYGPRYYDMGRRSSAHTMAVVDRADPVLLQDGVEIARTQDQGSQSLRLGHTGYLSTHGIAIERSLTLTADGQALGGTERFLIPADSEKTFAAAARGATIPHLPTTVHFHLSPEVAAQINLGGTILSLALPNGQVWGFRQAGGKLTLKPSVLMTPNRLRPLATQQIQISGDITAGGIEFSWLLERLE